ncbi:MAG: hypothetical protein EXS35_09865 [Pedosphaera sp.]|nr:hypothetical protein [Pedosphaera sp.]
MKPQFEPITFYGQGLSPEGKQVLDEVSQAMQPWIESSVNKLYETAAADASRDLEGLKKSIEETEKLLSEMQIKFDTLNVALDGIVTATDTAERTEKIVVLKNSLKATQDDFLQRQEKWKSVGKAFGDKLIKAGMTAVGVPPLV